MRSNCRIENDWSIKMLNVYRKKTMCWKMFQKEPTVLRNPMSGRNRLVHTRKAIETIEKRMKGNPRRSREDLIKSGYLR